MTRYVAAIVKAASWRNSDCQFSRVDWPKVSQKSADQAHPLRGRLRHGLLARARSRVAPPARAVDDGTVVQRIRSEALRDVGVSTTDVDVEVRDGVAVLRGAVAIRSLADDLVARVHGVPGVRDVEDTLDVAGLPASS